MARGRKPKPKQLPEARPDENASFRSMVYHLCGQEIYSQSVPDRLGSGFHMVFFATRGRKDREPLQVCPKCAGRVSRRSIRLQGEQYMYELAQEELAIALQAEEERAEDAETDQPS